MNGLGRTRMDDNNDNVVSIAEWRSLKRRLDSMTLYELAMTTHRLIDVMIDVGGHLEEIKQRLKKLES